MGFLKLIVQVFLVCFELTWVGVEKGGGSKGGGSKGGGSNPEKVGARRVGGLEGGGPGGWGPEGWGPKFRAFFPVPPQNTLFSSI